jgi:hypothetical protein
MPALALLKNDVAPFCCTTSSCHAESASISSTGTDGGPAKSKIKAPSGGREMMSLDMLRDVMEALLLQVCEKG